MNRREFIFSSIASAILPSFGSAKLNECGDNLDKLNAELQDLIEFSKTCTICNTVDGVIKFNPRPYQIEYFKNMLESKHLVCRKCRQCGATTMNLIYAHWAARRHPEKKVVLVFNKYGTAYYAESISDGMIPFEDHQNTPNVKFTTYADFFGTFSKVPYAKINTDRKINTDGTSGSRLAYSSGYLNSNTIVIFDEYAFSKHLINAEKIFAMFDSSMKTVWTSTPFTANDMLWGNGKSGKTVTRLTISGDQVFSAERIRELRACLDETHFKQEIDVSNFNV